MGILHNLKTTDRAHPIQTGIWIGTCCPNGLYRDKSTDYCVDGDDQRRCCRIEVVATCLDGRGAFHCGISSECRQAETENMA